MSHFKQTGQVLQCLEESEQDDDDLENISQEKCIKELGNLTLEMNLEILWEKE